MFFALALAGAGCASPLAVKYEAKEAADKDRIKVPLSIAINPVKDARPAEALSEARTIGRVEATVVDYDAPRLTLERDVTDMVESAFAEELKAAGYAVVGSGAPDGADFILSAEVREFRLDIASRDTVAMEVATSIVETETGKTVWSGTEAERGEKFAGVMGNSRQTIANYLNQSLSKVVKKTLAGAASHIGSTRAAYRPAGVSGAPLAGERPALAPANAAPAAPSEGTGRVAITTEPARARVYIKDVYYGLTPLSIDMEPGVYEIIVKMRGRKASGEKVSVRKGQLTELELVLEGE